jgi:rhomboid protease GluP
MPSESTRFSVRFLRPEGRLMARALVGRGTVDISGDTLVLTGTRRPLFGFGEAVTLRLALADVANVDRTGTIVRFAVPAPAAPGTRETVSLSAASESDAVALEARLPQTETADAVQEREEHVSFAVRLGQATPRAPVGPVLIALNVGVFVLMAASGVAVFEPKTSDLVVWGANFAPLTTDGQWWRLLTAAFLHGGVLHLALNMWALFTLTAIVERVYGNVSFLWLYLFSALAGSAASILWKQNVVSVGASGAVFGVYGGLLAYLVVQRGSMPASILQQLYMSTLPFVGYNLVYGFVGKGIDNAAHVGGLIGGFVMGAVLARPLARDARRAMRVSRLGAGLVIGALLLAGVLALVPDSARGYRQEQSFRAEVARFADEEGALNAEFNRLVKERQNRAIDDRALADRLTPVAQRWAAAHARMSALEADADAPWKKRHELLVRYIGLRRDTYRMLVDALGSNDPQKFDEFQRLRAAADGALKEINAAAPRSPL